jgi:hypothetical protein
MLYFLHDESLDSRLKRVIVHKIETKGSTTLRKRHAISYSFMKYIYFAHYILLRDDMEWLKSQNKLESMLFEACSDMTNMELIEQIRTNIHNNNASAFASLESTEMSHCDKYLPKNNETENFILQNAFPLQVSFEVSSQHLRFLRFVFYIARRYKLLIQRNEPQESFYLSLFHFNILPNALSTLVNSIVTESMFDANIFCCTQMRNNSFSLSILNQREEILATSDETSFVIYIDKSSTIESENDENNQKKRKRLTFEASSKEKDLESLSQEIKQLLYKKSLMQKTKDFENYVALDNKIRELVRLKLSLL